MKKDESLTVVDKQQDIYRNPIALAREWQEALSTDKYPMKKALAADAGVHPSSVSRILGLLRLHPEVIRAVLFPGDPLPGPIVTVARLCVIGDLPPEQQKTALKEHLHKNGITVLNL